MAPELLERSCLPRCIFLVVSDAESKILPSIITITGYIPCFDIARIKFHLFVLCCPWTLNWNRERLIFFLKLELKVRTRQWWTNYRSWGWWGKEKKTGSSQKFRRCPQFANLHHPFRVNEEDLKGLDWFYRTYRLRPNTGIERGRILVQ